MRRRLVSMLLAAMLSACANGNSDNAAKADPKGVAIPYQVVAQGQHSGIGKRQFVVVEQPAQWRTLWQDHRGSRSASPPDIDFNRYRLVAIFMGEQRSGGYRIDVQRIEKRGNTLWVTLDEQRPKPDQMVTMALTQPFVMVKIPRLPGEIRLETDEKP